MSVRPNLKRRRDDDDEMPLYSVDKKMAKLEATNGSILAIAGNDFVLIASDNRLVFDAGNSHKHFKLFPITAKTIVGSVSDLGHSISLTSSLKYHADMYELQHMKPLGTESLLSMIKIMMYNYRLLRSFMGTILVGLDKEGKGAVFKYDDQHGFKRCCYYAIGGAGHTMLQYLRQDIDASCCPTETLTKQRAFHIAQKCFNNAACFIVGIGDLAKFIVISKDGVEELTTKLK